jgi:cobalt-zinc-cadmium efflux system membrane fusion protein
MNHFDKTENNGLTRRTTAGARRGVAAMVVALAAGLLAGCHKEADVAKAVAQPAKVGNDQVVFPPDSEQLSGLKIESAKASAAPIVHLPGRLVWNEGATVRIFSPFGGRVVKLNADIGEAVAARSVLANIASPDFGQAQADAKKATTDLSLSDRNLTRLRDLQSHGAAAEKDVQAAEADYGRAIAEKTRSQARLAQFDATDGAIDNAFSLRTPSGGIVVEKNINPGQEVRADQMLAGIDRLAAPLFVVTDPSKLWLMIDVAEADLPKIQKGQALTVRSQTYPDRSFSATIDYISDGLDPITRTARARASVDNSSRSLKAEMLVWADLSTSSIGAVDVNARAVFLKGEKHFVFTETSKGNFTRREVLVGVEHEGQIQVLGGLKEGDRVVADGALLLDLVADNSSQGT